MFKELEGRLAEAVHGHSWPLGEASVGVAVQSFSRSNDAISIDGDEVHYAASLIKIPIMVEVFKQAEEGRVSFGEKLVVDHRYTLQDGDDVTQLRRGTRLTVGELLAYSILNSDNEAANMLADRVTIAAINERMDSLALPNTKVSHLMAHDVEVYDTGVLDGESNTTTAGEMCTLMRKIYQGEVCDEQYTTMMIRLLEEFRGFGEHLYNVNGHLAEKLPKNVRMGEKTGLIEDCVHSVGVVDRGYSIAVLVGDIDYTKAIVRADSFISALSEWIFEVYAEKTKPFFPE